MQTVDVHKHKRCSATPDVRIWIVPLFTEVLSQVRSRGELLRSNTGSRPRTGRKWL
ncbi:hypothetical protein [Pseudomonas mangiferae]|uniref:hypothetical protein n=1 Tax=Pseudomonas mangiferae TaxID=2593654 RepID=UPI0015B46138|nr:hypothetical protein [Pseudomonas mangiferae]